MCKLKEFDSQKAQVMPITGQINNLKNSTTATTRLASIYLHHTNKRNYHIQISDDPANIKWPQIKPHQLISTEVWCNKKQGFHLREQYIKRCMRKKWNQENKKRVLNFRPIITRQPTIRERKLHVLCSNRRNKLIYRIVA